ncbi:uncharacterized protein DNG_01522 [Cephalotrichum gorgonifer]|uniref:PAS domain-containing protein n=1 Tax=Cephalotrichum gorgonifer TaxID=2041049 RepID=A0AAE8SRX0_9PEZI|nr:uncharacterized protein DNG_01522 [Cephalotrichum gorgonifer]
MLGISTPASPPYHYDDFGRRRSSTALASETATGAHALRSKPPILSPPPTPKVPRSRPKGLSQRLRSNSGLSLHMNEDALRKYTDYNPDGSSRSPLFKPVNWQPQGPNPSPAGTRTSLLSEDKPEWTLPVPDLLGPEAFQMALQDPVVAHELLKFSREMGSGNDVEYLLKTQEYAASVEQLSAVLSNITTHYTSPITATFPVQLPSQVSRSLSADLKHVIGGILPGLENLFLESASCVEQRVFRDVYPAFVKHQLASATTTSLGWNVRLPDVEYPGLGSAFCMTDVNLGENNIKYASDEFISITGCTRDKIVQANDLSLQEYMTDPETSRRIRRAISRKEECVELVVNRRGDGELYWNLAYLCPLPDSSGTPRYYLHSYINLSDRIRTPSDAMQVLGGGSTRWDAPSDGSPELAPYRRRASTPFDQSDEGRGQARSRERDIARSRSSRRMFKPFRKAADLSGLAHTRSESALSGSSTLTENTLPPLSEHDTLSHTPPEVKTAHSRFLLLRHEEGIKPKLVVSHATPSALELLNPALTTEAVLDRDVFKVLAEQAHCPSITKSFKGMVRDGLSEGRRVTAELSFAAPRSRKGSVISLGGSRAEVGRRGMVQVNSFWTPLRGEGRVEWVVLVLVPCAGV